MRTRRELPNYVTGTNMTALQHAKNMLYLSCLPAAAGTPGVAAAVTL